MKQKKEGWSLREWGRALIEKVFFTGGILNVQ